MTLLLETLRHEVSAVRLTHVAHGRVEGDHIIVAIECQLVAAQTLRKLRDSGDQAVYNIKYNITLTSQTVSITHTTQT